MRFELWGATTLPRLTFPDRPIGYVILGVYCVLLAYALYHNRAGFRQLSYRQWLLTLGLILGSLLMSQLFPISLLSENQLPPLASAQNPVQILAPFGFVPFLLAGAILNPLAALLVGFASGLGRALWQTHQIFDPFHFAFAALLAAGMMQQNYSGRLYAILRKPLVAGLFSALLILPLTALATFAYADAGAGTLAALDLALSTSSAYMAPLLVEGILGGVIVTLLLIGLPQLRQSAAATSSPVSRSLNRRLVTTFFVFSSLLSFVVVVIGFRLAIKVATEIAVQQMAHDAQSVSERIPEFRNYRQQMLVESSRDQDLLSASSQVKEEALRRLFRSGDIYRQLVLIDNEQTVSASYPPESSAVDLSNLESTAISRTLTTSAPFISPAVPTNPSSHVITFVVPVPGDGERPEGALVGRVPDISLDELIVGLQGTLGNGLGFLVDEQGQVIAHPDSAIRLKSWNPPANERRQITPRNDTPGFVFLGFQGSTNARQLVYYLTGPDHPWTVVITLPYEVILGQALQIAAQLAAVMAIAMLLSGGYLLLLGQTVTQPLTDLAKAAQKIASGSLDTPIRTRGADEIGRLGRAFGQMQSSLRLRLDELSLLLSVSRDVSGSIDLNRGMPSVLKGALRGTGAAGVRVIVQNPNANKPLTFGEGPANKSMALLDRKIMSLLSQRRELILSSPQAVTSTLQLNQDPEKWPKALIAIPLLTKKRYQGAFWLAYRQAHNFDQTELSFLRTLASQASVFVENAWLYATAEGGRRRLAAVLASTSDAVIVTDQTNRILLVNAALEQIFEVTASEVKGRPVKAVIKSRPLVEALTNNRDGTQKLEIYVKEGQCLYVSASTVYSNEGQAMGRVAVLHDITDLKEIDALKSEFVATVSHDLRSPLTYMLGYATTLSMFSNLEPKQKEYVEKIITGIDQMSLLIDELLDLGRLEAGVDIKVSNFHVGEVLNSVAVEYQPLALENGITLSCQAPDDLPTARGDISLIRLAVANLVGNAIKYAPDSGTVILDALLKHEQIVISVRDNGPGIAKEDQLRLFEKFYRVKQNGKGTVKGSGLGLSMVKSIAERHGGQVWCESTVGKGSTFYLSLPVNRGAIA